MAGANSIQILRGTRKSIINAANNNVTLLPGQPLYNETDNYLTIGDSTGTTRVNAPPIAAMELHGYASEIGGLSETPRNEYSIRSNYVSSTLDYKAPGLVHKFQSNNESYPSLQFSLSSTAAVTAVPKTLSDSSVLLNIGRVTVANGKHNLNLLSETVTVGTNNFKIKDINSSTVNNTYVSLTTTPTNRILDINLKADGLSFFKLNSSNIDITGYPINISSNTFLNINAGSDLSLRANNNVNINANMLFFLKANQGIGLSTNNTFFNLSDTYGGIDLIQHLNTGTVATYTTVLKANTYPASKPTGPERALLVANVTRNYSTNSVTTVIEACTPTLGKGVFIFYESRNGVVGKNIQEYTVQLSTVPMGNNTININKEINFVTANIISNANNTGYNVAVLANFLYYAGYNGQYSAVINAGNYIDNSGTYMKIEKLYAYSTSDIRCILNNGATITPRAYNPSITIQNYRTIN